MREKACSSLCPECGWDLAFEDLECSCKNPDCSWHCVDCKKTDGNETNANA